MLAALAEVSVIATIDAEIETTTAPDAIVGLIRLFCEFAAAWPPGAELKERLVWAAVEHGHQRRSQGEGEARIFEDYDRLRAALWQGIRKHPYEPGVASELILRIDSAISLAVAAALRGYYQDVIMRSGEWPIAVERLLWEWRVREPVQGER